MTNVVQETDDLGGETRFEHLQHGEVLAETDQPSAAYKQLHGQQEVDLSQIDQTYRALVTAHYPDRASADAALAQLRGLNLGDGITIQEFFKEAPDAPGDRNDEGLAPGEVGLIVQMDDESMGETLLRVCEVGAKHARFYPRQRLSDASAAAAAPAQGAAGSVPPPVPSA